MSRLCSCVHELHMYQQQRNNVFCKANIKHFTSKKPSNLRFVVCKSVFTDAAKHMSTIKYKI